MSMPPYGIHGAFLRMSMSMSTFVDLRGFAFPLASLALILSPPLVLSTRRASFFFFRLLFRYRLPVGKA